MHFVSTRGGHDTHLSPRTLPILRAVSVGNYVEFTNGVDTEQLAAGAAWRQVDFGGACIFDPVQQEQILLRLSTGNREHIADSRVRRPNASGALRGVIHNTWIQGDQFVVAASVERQLLYLTLTHEPGGLLRRHAHHIRMLFDRHTLLQPADHKGQIHGGLLSHNQANSGLYLGCETCFLSGDFVASDRDRWSVIPPAAVRYKFARSAGFRVLHRHRNSGNGSPSGVGDDTGNGPFRLRPHQAGEHHNSHSCGAAAAKIPRRTVAGMLGCGHSYYSLLS